MLGLAREVIEHPSSGTGSSFYRRAITDGREGKMAPSSLFGSLRKPPGK